MCLPGASLAWMGLGEDAKVRVSMYREKSLISAVRTGRNHRSATARLALGADQHGVGSQTINRNVFARSGSLRDYPEPYLPGS